MYDITLDTNKGGFQAVLEGFKLGDTKTRSVVIRLMSGLKPYSLPIKEDGSADYTATLYIKGATATHYSECTAYPDCIEHTFLTSEIEAGESECEVRIIGSGGERLTSAKFKIYAEAVLQNDTAIEATDTYSALDKALAEVKDVQTGLDTKMPKVPGAEKNRIAVFDGKGNVMESDYTADDIDKGESPQLQSAPADPAAVRDMIQCAMTYVSNKESLTYTDSGAGTMFDSDFNSAAAKIDCSAFAMACILGIPYEWSKYNGKDNVRHCGYGIQLPANPYAADRPNRYYSHELAHLFDDKGWCFTPAADYSNIAPGDIIFVSFSDFTSDYHNNAYLKIDHCLLVIGYKDDKHLICLHSSAANTLGVYDVPVLKSDYDSTSENSYNNSIRLAARLPFNRSAPMVGVPLITDATAKTTASSSNGQLATLTLSHNLKKNTPYTLIAHIENAYAQQKPSANNYVGIRATYASGGADETVFSWQRNEYPKDNLYRCCFVTGDKEISKLKLYVLNTTVAGHKYSFCALFEGLVAPTPVADGFSAANITDYWAAADKNDFIADVISAAGGESKSFVLEYKSEYSESEETALAAKLVEIAADTSNAPVYIKDNNNIIPAAVYRRSKIRADVSAVHQNDISSAVYIISNYPGLQYSKSNLYVGDMLSGSLSTAAAPTCFAAALYTATQFVEGYELIATVTTTEAANQVVIDTDAAGNAFALDAAWLFAEVPAGTAGVVYVRYDDAEATKIVSMQVTNAINTAARYWNSRLENHRGMWELVQTAGASTAGSVNTSSRPAGLIGLANVGIASVKVVKSTVQIPAGTKLTLYGIRSVISDV